IGGRNSHGSPGQCPEHAARNRQGKMGSGRYSSGGSRERGNWGSSRVERRNRSPAGARSNPGDPAADAFWASTDGSEHQRRRDPEGTEGDRSQHPAEPSAIAGQSGSEGRDSRRGRHAPADEGCRALGHSLRARALSKGRGQGQRSSPDDGAHEPPDGLLAPDSEAARRKDEQGRDSGGVARRHTGPYVLGGSAGVRQEKRADVA